MHKIYLHLEKGGTGKSISVYHLSCMLGELFNKRVLVVDLDAQKNVSFLFGVDGDEIVSNGGCSIAHCLAKDLNLDRERRSIKDCIIKDVSPNVDLAVSSSNIVQAEISILSEMFNKDLLLANALKEVEEEYDYVFIDTHSTYDQIFINAIRACDLVIPTMKTDFQNLQNFTQTMNNLEAMAKQGVNPDIGGVLTTVFEWNTIQSKQCIQYLYDNGYSVWGCVKKQVAVQDSVMCNMPIHKYAPTSQGTLGYLGTVHNILNHYGEDFKIPMDNTKFKKEKRTK